MITQAKKLKIISRSSEPFEDRQEAGKSLVEFLRPWATPQTVVLGIPRGGLVIAQEIAKALNCPLDVILAHKLGAPGNPELAIGAVAENGKTFLNPSVARQVGADPEYIDEEVKLQLDEIRQERDEFRRFRPKLNLKNKIAIVCDDGVATGATLQASLWSARQEEPKILVAALPVGPEKSLEKLSQTADEVVCLKVPRYLTSVGRYYLHFEQVTDEEVKEILRSTSKNGGKVEG